MKFKTWEKIYWGILAGILVFSLIGIAIHKGDIPAKIYGEDKLFSKGTAVIYVLIGYVIIWLPLWLLIRWLVNKGDKDKKK